ncbi:MAG TPA: CHRD domain-containing protein [Candidatus Acidoferrum sp.]|nr:CHRD domain-containing protein [Candidatus Acidoferrum sp.]
MRTVAVCLLFFTSLSAQTAETQIFRAILLPANEVPPINNAARAIADVVVHVVRDATGAVASGTIDVQVRTMLNAVVTATGLTVNNAPSGRSAPGMFSAGLSASNNRVLATGADAIHLPIAVAGDNAVTLAGLRAMLDDPTQFYVNLTSSDQPNGLMRGQLARTLVTVLLAPVSSDNVVPAAGSFGTGVAQVVAIGTRDANGNWTSGEVYLSSTYSSQDPTVFNGFHIHAGPAGSNGAIGLSATLFPGSAPDYLGLANLGPYYAEIATNNTTQTGAFTNLFVNPGSLYVDIHTTQNTNGIVRGQLRTTDAMTFPVLLDSNKLLTPQTTRALAPARFTIYTLRREDGSVAAATMLTDVDYRFPGPVQFLGAYLHDGDATTDGPIAIQATPDFTSDTGCGNYFGWSLPLANLAGVEDTIRNPSRHYASLHTFDDPTGAARGQFGPAPQRAVVTAAIGANLDKTATTVAPGGLISIFGIDLAHTATDLGGWTGRQLPASLNGSTVRIAGKAAPLIYVSPGQINAQVPFDAPAGVQTLSVDNGSGASADYSVVVAPTAPAIFFYPTAAVLKNANYSLITAANPARAGDTLLVFCTGLGQSTPPVATGQLVASDAVARTATVTATLGGRPATVVYSIVSPGFTGLYQVAVTVPAGVTGPAILQLQMGTVSSNQVTINIQ